jgi:hypothetical protein
MVLNTAKSELFQPWPENKNHPQVVKAYICFIKYEISDYNKFQIDRFKNNEEKAIIVFCSFGFSGSIFFKSHHIHFTLS